ncbi:SRPBCC domain-containing protein [Roseivirga sp. E12]|uniref:SRPBCC family protein n=1 Tax=Roseivirga sp. E12 TaxID=2819237 RepID=UPI001ABC3C7C|nr:SRPBCC domain-containing protein [Roseivirga sp. E12]MBO3697751.1 SRPBCC domain-containing protein [Roseivirga sp. E12]
MSNSNDLNDRTLTIERILKAPIQIVWDAWSQPEHIAQWWGPKGMEVKIETHSFTEGGDWKYIMTMPNGSDFIAEGTYTEIVEHTKICSTANFRPMTEGVEIQALFEAQGDLTKFTFNVVHPTVEYCQQQEKMGFMNGWGSVFNELEEHLAKQMN